MISPVREQTGLQIESEHKSNSWGSVLLGIVLGVFLLIQTENALSDIQYFLDQPHCPLNNCKELSPDDLNPWLFTNAEREYQLPTRFSPDQETNLDEYPELVESYTQLRDSFSPLGALQKEIQDTENLLRDAQLREQGIIRRYKGELLEEMSPRIEKAIPEQSNKVKVSIATSDELSDSLSQLRDRETLLITSLDDKFQTLQVQHRRALDKYQKNKKIFELKLFAIQFLLTIPLLLLGYFWYRRSREHNSKYSILPLVILIIGAITFLQVLGVYAASWIPFALITRLFDWINAIPLGRVITHYIVIAFGIITIGLIIVGLQKRLFSDKRQILRRLKKGECPHCEIPLKLSDEYCSGCGEQLKVKCQNCQHSTLKALDHCQHCGKKINNF